MGDGVNGFLATVLNMATDGADSADMDRRREDFVFGFSCRSQVPEGTMLSWLKVRSESALFLLGPKFCFAWFFFPWGFAMEIDPMRRLEL